jgi:hypothetical protein
MVAAAVRNPCSKLPHQLEDTLSSNFNALDLEDASSTEGSRPWVLGPCFAQVTLMLKLISANLIRQTTKDFD